jgi:hypothetical protein
MSTLWTSHDGTGFALRAATINDRTIADQIKAVAEQLSGAIRADFACC